VEIAPGSRPGPVGTAPEHGDLLMQIKKHDRVLKIEQIKLRHEPLSVFLVSNVELIIQRGDRLGDVARTMQPHMPWFSRQQLRGIAGYYFAMGERSARDRLTKPWRRKEFNSDPDRRYLEGIEVTT